jgi:trehalose 6-phosphate phosphatase
VVISGRAHHDLATRLGRLPLWEVFGNHGVEPWAESAASAAQVNAWVEHLRVQLATHTDLVIENKKYSITIHYRAVRDQAGIRKAVANAVETLPNVRVLAGPQAVNLIPRGGPDKGVALQKARAALACRTAIYIGDDDTDEDAFVSAPRDQLLAIRVGHSRKSAAHFRLNTQADIDVLLRALLAVRAVPAPKAVYRGNAR